MAGVLRRSVNVALGRTSMDQEQDRSARGLELVGASGLAFDRAALLANLGSIDIEQSRADRAEGHYAEASATARPLGCPPGRSPGDRPMPVDANRRIPSRLHGPRPSFSAAGRLRLDAKSYSVEALNWAGGGSPNFAVDSAGVRGGGLVSPATASRPPIPEAPLVPPDNPLISTQSGTVGQLGIHYLCMQGPAGREVTNA
jgi:hypothetical protein